MNGETLYNAAEIMMKVGDELDALLDKLYPLVEKAIASLNFVQKVDDFTYYEEKNNWATTGYLLNYEIFGKRVRKTTAYIGLQIKLCDEREVEIVCRQPLFIVLYSSKEEWSDEDFLLSSAIESGWRLTDGWLWEKFEKDEDRTSPRPWNKSVWAFVVPLVSLNTPEDLDQLIVKPIKMLLKRDSGKNILRVDEGICRFEVKDSVVKLLSCGRIRSLKNL